MELSKTYGQFLFLSEGYISKTTAHPQTELSKVSLTWENLCYLFSVMSWQNCFTSSAYVELQPMSPNDLQLESMNHNPHSRKSGADVLVHCHLCRKYLHN